MFGRKAKRIRELEAEVERLERIDRFNTHALMLARNERNRLFERLSERAA